MTAAIRVKRETAVEEVREAAAHAILDMCPNCDGSGHIPVSRAEHAPGCDGSCSAGCPVEVQDWETCQCGGIFSAAAERIRSLQFEVEQGWVSVEERLPEIGVEVLATTAKGWQLVTRREDWKSAPQWHGKFAVENDCGPDATVTHWRPLPAPPTVEGETTT